TSATPQTRRSGIQVKDRGRSPTRSTRRARTLGRCLGGWAGRCLWLIPLFVVPHIAAPPPFGRGVSYCRREVRCRRRLWPHVSGGAGSNGCPSLTCSCGVSARPSSPLWLSVPSRRSTPVHPQE